MSAQSVSLAVNHSTSKDENTTEKLGRLEQQETPTPYLDLHYGGLTQEGTHISHMTLSGPQINLGNDGRA